MARYERWLRPLDLAVERLLVYENRERLANDTSCLFLRYDRGRSCRGTETGSRDRRRVPRESTLTNSPLPRRGEIWTANLGNPPIRHWVLIVSLDQRNLSDRTDSVLIVPFSSKGPDGSDRHRLPPGETGLPGPSFVKGHYMQVLAEARLAFTGKANAFG